MADGPGAVFGPYRLEKELGRGAAGVVYEAFDARLGRSVALKLVSATASDQARIERFKREAQVQARLAHPNVVRVYEAGFERGQLYLALELVKGRSLRHELARRGALPAREALALVAQVARGVHAAHLLGVVHRDLKPENVLLDARGTPRVTDFGVAKALGPGTPRLSHTGQLLGTPLAMAPEQLSGDSEVTPLTDVWALGVLLFELVSGEPPFQASDLVALAAQIAGAPPRSVAPRGREERVALGVALRALAKSPAARPPSAEAFARLCDEALSAPPRRRARPLAAALFGLALGLGGALAVLPAPPAAAAPASAPGRAEAPRAVEPLTVSSVATLSLGPLSLGRIAVAGDAIVGAAPGGGPVATCTLDGSLLGEADEACPAWDRFVSGRGAIAAWATESGLALAQSGFVRERSWPERLGPVAASGSVVVAYAGGRLLVFRADRDEPPRELATPIVPREIALSEDGRSCAVVGESPMGPQACLFSLEQPELPRFCPVRAKESPVAFLDGCLAVESGLEAPVVLHDPPPAADRARKIPLQDWGVVAALGGGPYFVVVARRGTREAPHDLIQVYSLDGRFLSTLQVEGEIASIAPATHGAELLVIGRFSGPALVVRIPPDGHLAVEHEVRGPERVPCAAFLDAKGERVALGGLDGRTTVFAVGSEVRRAWRWSPGFGGNPLRALGATERGEDGQRVLIHMDGSADRGATLRALEERDAPAEPLGVTSPGYRFDLWALAPLGERAVAASSVEPARRLAAVALPAPGTRQDFFCRPMPDAEPASALAFAPDGRTLATALARGGVLLDEEGAAGARRIESRPLRALAFAPDGALAGVARSGEAVSLAGEPLPPGTARVQALAFSPDGLVLALLRASGDLELRARSSGALLARVRGIAVRADALGAPPLAWSQDGGRLLAGSGPVSILAVARGPIAPEARSRLEALLAASRAAGTKRRAWALCRAVAAAPWAHEATVIAARDREPRLLLEARVESWEALAATLDDGDDGKARVLEQAAAFARRAR